MRKKFLAGATVLALLMNAPQVSADDEVIIFGGEFDDDIPAPKVTKPVEQPIQPAEPEPRPIESVQPTEPEPRPIEPVQPTEVEPRPIESVQPTEVEPRPIESVQPTEIEPRPIESVQPTEVEPRPIEPLQEIERPFAQTEISGEREPAPVQPTPIQPTPIQPRRSTRPTQQQTLRTIKPRFVKLAADDTYTYYLDKTSVQWKRMPYSASEYIADVWIRMVEREPKPLDDDMASYGEDNFNAEIAFAREQGYQYSPEDLKVLQSRSYVLEHYLLRPKTKQIQFLCELEVIGRPQNTINERAYDYRNWESLVPGSIESAVYSATIKIIGKGMSDSKGHMTFFDMLDEYARIALN